MKRTACSKLKNRLSNMGIIERLIADNQRLIAHKVNTEFLQRGKHEALADYTEAYIKRYNAAIAATNGPKPKETAEQYRARLVAANKK